MQKVNNTKKERRYELEVEGAKCFLAPLSFQVAEAALGFIFLPRPKKVMAGEIILNSLFLEGSPKFKVKPGSAASNTMFWIKACLEAYKIVERLSYNVDEEDCLVLDFKGKDYKCKLNKDIDRDVFEEALGHVTPNIGNPMPLTAGRLILKDTWLEGDDEILTNHELLVPACLAAYYRIEKKEGSLKKL